MKIRFKVGNIVQDGTLVSSIKKIEGEYAYLAKKYKVKLEKLVPVEIGGDFDNGIVLNSIIPIRASIVAPGKSVPIRKPKSYIECEIGETTIASIIETNGFKYIHELQDWLAKQAPDLRICKRI